ncbi:MAG: hypothetical protein KGL35_13570 [Bradyrhizobium sp.]|nr:hypothetical protein [Nitrososphaerota archaeon]MDE2469728.1 hypothetical protein [Bradyrhizobium sp.]
MDLVKYQAKVYQQTGSIGEVDLPILLEELLFHVVAVANSLGIDLNKVAKESLKHHE